MSTEHSVTCRHCGVGIVYLCDHDEDDVPAEDHAELRARAEKAEAELRTCKERLQVAEADLAAANTTAETLRMTELPKGWMAAPRAEWDEKDARIERLAGLLNEATTPRRCHYENGCLDSDRDPACLPCRINAAPAPRTGGEEKWKSDNDEWMGSDMTEEGDK